jgi:hypothetical protein
VPELEVLDGSTNMKPGNCPQIIITHVSEESTVTLANVPFLAPLLFGPALVAIPLLLFNIQRSSKPQKIIAYVSEGSAVTPPDVPSPAPLVFGRVTVVIPLLFFIFSAPPHLEK